MGLRQGLPDQSKWVAYKDTHKLGLRGVFGGSPQGHQKRSRL